MIPHHVWHHAIICFHSSHCIFTKAYMQLLKMQFCELSKDIPGIGVKNLCH